MTVESLVRIIGYIAQGSTVAIEVFVLTLVFSLPLGLLACYGRMSKWALVREPVKFYLLIMRGTPLILQLFFFFYMPFYVFGGMLPRFWAAILTCSINYAAYFAEIYRGGIESMPKGQYEAANVLGFSKGQTFFKIILPQVIKRILPSMGNEFMTLVKDTALVSVIGVAELYQIATDTMSKESTIIPLVVAGGFYLLMNSIVAKCFELAERKIGYYR